MANNGKGGGQENGGGGGNGHGGGPGNGGGGSGGDPKITLVFVINGDPQAVSINPQQKLASARSEALTLSENQGQPAEQWNITTVEGAPLDPERKIVDLGLRDGTRLLLALKAGAGG